MRIILNKTIILNLTGFYISIALTRVYATCHSERKEPLALSAVEGEESHTRNGTKSCYKARCFVSLSMTVLKSVKLTIIHAAVLAFVTAADKLQEQKGYLKCF